MLGKKTYYSDLVIWWDGKKAMIPKTHLLNSTFLKKILAKKPDSLIVGIGLKGSVKLTPAFIAGARKEKVPLFVDRTMNAMEIFNAFVAVGKKPVCVMHVSL